MGVSQIFIESLKITNFGPFYGTHFFDFSPGNDKRSIFVGGKTGSGKTHLLRALYLATVGESGAGDLKKVESGSEATKFDLKSSLNRRARSEGENTSEFEINLSLRDPTGLIGRSLKLTRQIRHRPSSPPIFTAKAYLENDNVLIEDEKQVTNLRDNFLPRHLARFFFFDAERSQNLQLNERDIIEGITRVLGLYSYTELEDDLHQLIKNKIPQRFGAGTDVERELNRVVSENQRIESDLETYLFDIQEKKREIQELEHELVNIEDELKSFDAVDPEELESLNNKRDQIKVNKTKLEENLVSAWESALPVALMGGFRQKLHEALTKEELRRDWENRKSSIEPKIPKIKKEVFGQTPPDYTPPESVVEFYKSRLEEALKGLFHPPEDGIAESVYIVPERNEISIRIRNLLNEKASSISNIEQIVNDIDKMTLELRDMDRAIKEFNQDPESIKRGKELLVHRTTIEHQKSNLEKEQKELEEKVERLKAELQEGKKNATKLYEKVQKSRQGRDLNSLAHKYRDAVSAIRQRAAIQLRKKIAQIVGDIWLDVTDRGLEFTGMEFDNNWNCTLIKTNGSKVPWDAANTSAGQRQVRVLAFTEALRRLAKFAPPLVVDTPLGRLDREVKKGVLDRLYLSGHQSIILTTNSEIPPNSHLFEEASPKLARVYTLNPEGDQESQSYHVNVTQDYFKRVL